MKNKLISVLTVAFALFFLAFVVQTTDDLSNAKRNLLKSLSIIDVTNLISTKLLITPEELSPNWTNPSFDDAKWESVSIPSYQIVQNRKFKEGNFAYYRIKLPDFAFNKLSHLKNETSIALQYTFFSQIDVSINGVFFRTIKPKNSIEANVILPVKENQENIISLKGYIRNGDTGIDHRDKILLGSGAELNALHSLSYKVQTVFQLIFILCKGSILLIFALIYLLLKVETSFEKFFIFGLCAVLEELIAGEYLLGPLDFNQMVYLYNVVNVGGAVAVILFFAELNQITLNKKLVNPLFAILFLISSFLAFDALHWNYVADLTKFMKFWNLVFVGIMFFYIPSAFKRDRVVFIVLLTSIGLYVWGALFAVNIGLNFKAYGNLLLFILVAYQTFVIFKREQDQLQSHVRQLLEQEKDVAIGRTASLLAHDVRKPLDQLKLVIEKLASGEMDRQFLEIAKKDLDISIATVDQQVSDIVNYSKTSHISLSEVSFYRILGHAIKQVMAIHQEMDINLEYDFKAHSKVLGDQARLAGALVNLVSNAVEAIRDIGNRYKGVVRFSSEEVEGDFVFRIFNDGPEIPNEIIEQIFKPLFTNGKTNGTGLGLASVQKTVNEHSGFIEVNNISGKGVEFSLVLRKGTETDDWNSYSLKNNSKAYSYDIQSNKPSITQPSLRVLILENDSKNIQLINDFFSQMPNKVHVLYADSSNEALEQIKKQRFDFYLLSQMLGGDDIKLKTLPFLGTEVLVYKELIPQKLNDVCIKAFEKRTKVLFVDDTKIFRVAWLMYHGEHNIVCRSSPEEALAYLETNPDSVDIAVVDYHFSNSSMNGEGLAKKIKEMNPKITILISSSIEQQIENFKTISKKDYEVREYLSRTTEFSY